MLIVLSNLYLLIYWICIYLFFPMHMPAVAPSIDLPKKYSKSLS